eukprot:11909448-Alexandrium_andersonii.AAC.1
MPRQRSSRGSLGERAARRARSSRGPQRRGHRHRLQQVLRQGGPEEGCQGLEGGGLPCHPGRGGHGA